jgi:dephospho-CoA kinase
MERLRKRDGRSPEEALKLFSSQMLVEEKRKLADFVIQNEGSLEKMKKRAKEVFKELKRSNLQKRKKQ